jgi:type II restriction/modification system DNA methylase subunit YeeA
METAKLKKFAQFARRSLLEQVSAKLKLVLADNSAARRERAETVKKLEEAIKGHGKEQVIERVAYIWFNRFCALRFMDVNRYNRVNIVSPADPGQFQPEILAEAKMGHIDEEMVPSKVRQKIFALLDGKAPSRDPQGEAYSLLVVAACNFLHRAMPFLFQRIDDYTELLMPDDLLSGNSILAYTREAMTPDACEDVEVIGWLYQFYISEKKDEVFDGLKKNKKITAENIPAATQLFTPHWIVRYLVENSLGRLWLLNRPGSKLALQMDYYIKPADDENVAETDFLRISKPEEIKICDPACGSGHMLTYAFDLLYAIYEEEGYEPAEIPEKILTNNLYGIEIDERAGELAAFALTMKARAKQRRFFNKGVKPNICVLENVRFDEGELKNYMDFVGSNLFTAPLQTTLRQFEEADNFGSLIRPDINHMDGILNILASKNVSGQLFISMTHQKVLQALRQAKYLNPKYHVVIANPPYMGGKGMNGRLSDWAKSNYANSKYDLFAMFIERSLDLALKQGTVAMITMQSWMFLSSFAKFRSRLLGHETIISMVHLGPRAFDSIGGEVVSTTAFVLNKAWDAEYKGSYLRLVDGTSESEKEQIILTFTKNRDKDSLHYASANDFMRIPGVPIAYWASDKMRKTFDTEFRIGNVSKVRKGLVTLDDKQFIRLWHEVSRNRMYTTAISSEDAHNSRCKWFPINKGGRFRKWFGLNENVINWEENGKELKAFVVKRYGGGSYTKEIRSEDCYFKENITWGDITTSKIGFRYTPNGFIFSSVGPSAFFEDTEVMWLSLGLANSPYILNFAKIINPGIHFSSGDLATVPLIFPRNLVKDTVKSCISYAKNDWNSYENSWHFSTFPLLQSDFFYSSLKETYKKLRSDRQGITLEMQRLEEENNRIFVETYSLEEELGDETKPPLNEITLICNPYYRYGEKKGEEELEALLLADTMRELISYAVGCMFGRYALDKPGLILANQGETIEDYYKILLTAKNTKDTKEDQENNFSDFRDFRGSISFPADEDNVIPMLDGDWFTDDIAERFRKFLRVAFGDEHYEENLQFIEAALGKNGKARDIREYFLKDFYSDHVRRYKKRPIYWLFSSPKGSFNALIYMHRYRPDTVSVVLNDYLREFRTKLTSHKNHLEAVSISGSSSQSEKTKALKETLKITKMIAEMEEYEREVLYPLATEQVEIDLDDGVKVNYPKLGAALKKIVGLDI